jgi:hypothetical protein
VRNQNLFAAVAAVLLLATACGGDPPAEPLPDLVAVANALRASDNQYFGRGEHETVRARLAQLDPTDRTALVDLTVRMMWHQLRLGDVTGAVDSIERALEQARTLPQFRSQLARFHYWRGLAWLRRAEIENCVTRHNPACCIWPLEGGGVHGLRAPAATALSAFLDFLELQPDDFGVQWLANVAAMAAGGEENGLPERFRFGRGGAPASRSTALGVPRFVDRAPALGIEILDLAGGAIVADVDGDGFLDLVTSTSDPDGPMKLWKNLGNGRFADRSQASGLARQLGGLNCTQVDYDDDGDVDIMVQRGAWLMDDGRIRRSLLRNDGRGGFEDVTAQVGLAEPAYPSQAAAWGDFDGDGDLDLYVGNESRVEIGPRPGGDFPSQLFRNDGGRFTDVARQAGVTNDRYAKGVAAGDYDDDGDLDLYVSNVGRNRLYRNDGGMRFTDVAEELGVTEPGGRSFACWFFDYDHDGRLDLFVAGYQATLAEIAGDTLRREGRTGVATGGELPRLYRNLGGRFADVTRAAGLDLVTLPMGANFGDVDGDGWLDLYLGTGGPDYELLIPNVLLRNDGGRRFVDRTTASGLGHLQKGHGIAFADLDHDGDQDLFHQLGGFYPGDRYYTALYVNPGTGARFVVLELSGTTSNRMAIGARIEVEIATPGGPRILHRAVGAVSSFGGSTYRQEIGLGDATAIRRVTVRWPRGAVQRFTGVPLDSFVALVEGHPEHRVLERRKLDLMR